MEESLVTLATDHYTAAEILKARLEAAGIECFLSNVHLIQGAAPEGVKIQIKSDDIEKALRLVQEWKAEQEYADRKNPKTVRRVLVPVDFSDYSRNACMYALNLAQKIRAEVKILHVYYAPIVDLVPITDAYSIQVDMDINLREMEANARKSLTSFVNDIRQMASKHKMDDVKIGYALREGVTEDEIARMAKDYNPGIIVLGTKGKGEKQSDIIGSVVYRVLDRTRVPVLAIPENSTYNVNREVKNIAYATEFDDSDYVAIRRLLTILSEFKVKVHCIHLSKENRKSMDEVKMENLKDYFRKVHKGIEVNCHLLEGEDNLKEVESFVEKKQIDLFSMVNRKRGLLARLFNPGLTRKLIYQSTIPLLIFRA
jgi:nucleotide-binding universal stress UspA family protein